MAITITSHTEDEQVIKNRFWKLTLFRDKHKDLLSFIRRLIQVNAHKFWDVSWDPRLIDFFPETLKHFPLRVSFSDFWRTNFSASDEIRNVRDKRARNQNDRPANFRQHLLQSSTAREAIICYMEAVLHEPCCNRCSKLAHKVRRLVSPLLTFSEDGKRSGKKLWPSINPTLTLD